MGSLKDLWAAVISSPHFLVGGMWDRAGSHTSVQVVGLTRKISGRTKQRGCEVGFRMHCGGTSEVIPAVGEGEALGSCDWSRVAERTEEQYTHSSHGTGWSLTLGPRAARSA